MPRRATLVPVVALFLSGATLPGASHAAAPRAGLGTCVGIEDAQARLACYDRASGRAAPARVAGSKPPAKAAVAEPAPAAVATVSPQPEPAPRTAPRADSMIRSAWASCTLS